MKKVISAAMVLLAFACNQKTTPTSTHIVVKPFSTDGKSVAAGQPQHTAWAFQRPAGGRSFGFTGGHYHWNWGRTQILKLVSNAIVCTLRALRRDSIVSTSA